MKTGNSLSDSLSYYFRCIIIFEPVFIEVRTAWIRMVRFGDPTPELAEENLDLITFSYNEGKASMVDVLSAQLSWTQAHTSLINAYLAEKMAVAEYRKVISE